MFVRHLKDYGEFIAGDDSILREILHPDKAGVPIHYSLAHAKVEVGQKTRPHRLKSSEVYYIIEGRGLMSIDKETFEVGPDFTVYIPHDSVQYIENIGDSDLKFLCVVDPAWRQENEEVLDS